MAAVMLPLQDYMLGSDVSSNPELTLMAAEGDDEFDVFASFWSAGLAVTRPKSSTEGD